MPLRCPHRRPPAWDAVERASGQPPAAARRPAGCARAAARAAGAVRPWDGDRHT